MAFPNVVFGSTGSQFVVDTTATADLGTQMIFADGRKFRYAEKGTTTAVAGDVQSSAALISDHILQTPVAAAVGATVVSVALGATAIAADYYKNGYLAIELGTGFGYLYSIQTHPAVVLSGTFAAPLREPVQVAIPATANTVSLVPNKWKAVVVAPTTETGALAGVAIKPLTATQCGWLQTRGPASVTAVGTVVNGEPVAMITTAGAAGPMAATTTSPVGIAMHTATATNKCVVDLTIDG